jgi:hypothetical protein
MYTRIFRLEFLNISKYVKDVFKDKENICIQEPKHHFRDLRYIAKIKKRQHKFSNSHIFKTSETKNVISSYVK